ncbi:MAG TPA: hypothetical protein VE981_24175 [Planctomycetota bacterium]|nr:hypothetical protein [Planctomycetota bacterium]
MDQPAASQAPVSVGVALLWMTLYLALTTAGLIALTHLVGAQKNGLAMFGIWLLQLILIMGLAGWVNGKMGDRGGALFIVIILFAIYSLVYGLLLGHIPQLFRLRETPVIPLSDAAKPEYAGFDVFRFSDGKVDIRHIQRRTTVARNGRVNYFMAPVLPPDWKSGDPVPAWVAGEDINGNRPGSWDEDWRGGYRIGLETHYQEMVESSGPSHKTAPNAPILTWSKEPKAELLRVAWLEFGGFLLIDAIGLIAVLATVFMKV